MTENVPSLNHLKELIGKFLLLADDGIVDVILASTIANKLTLDPVWLMVVAGSSSGKSELLSPLFSLPFVIPISDLTVNTFASGYKMGGGKQAGLLAKFQSGVMVFKDFTSILSKGAEAKGIILGQMREIYDGKFDKHTGTGEQIAWKGKMGVLAAATGEVYRGLGDTNSMGQRFIFYNIKPPNRKAAAKRAQENTLKSGEMREELEVAYKEYITYVMNRIDEGDIDYTLPPELADEILNIADFACRARTPVHKDFKSGHIDDQPDLEGPGRVTKQLNAIAAAFIAMNQSEPLADLKNDPKKGAITDLQRRTIYRCAFDSIPSMRRTTMRLLALYRHGVNTTGAATFLNLPTDSVKKYLYELNALGICERKAESGNKGHKWTMKDEEMRRVVCLLEGISPKDEELIGHTEDDGDGMSLDPDAEESRRAMLEHFDGMPDVPDVN